jgi:peptide deformylase
MVTILDKDDPRLRTRAREILAGEFGSAKLTCIVADLKKALASQDDGVAIAAPQIGQGIRLFVISRKVWTGEFENLDEDEKEERLKKAPKDDVVFANPVITKQSREKRWASEGCLSVRWLYGKVRRSTRATIEAKDEHGKHFTMGASGLLAQIFQHETDHLDGILFIDKAKNIEDMPGE